VPDTADATQAAGQPDNDDAAQQTLADAGAQPEPQDGDRQAQNDPWADPQAARKEIEKLRREAAGFRTKLREAEPQLAEYRKHLDSQKTEQQKLAEAKEAAEQRLAEVSSANARLMAAATHNIPVELIDLLGTGTDEEIDARAKLLAERLTAADARTSATPGSTRPVESLTAGGRPADDAPADPNALFRAMLRRD
jgi:DNA repair exonuclease SbcCD ATPase subunit